MSYPITRIDPTTVGRERSPDLWRTALDRYTSHPTLGVVRSDQFQRPIVCAEDVSANGWLCSEDGVDGATSQVYNTNSNPNGEFVLGGTSGADYVGVKMQAASTAALGEAVVLPTATTDSKSDVIFEARVYLDLASNDTLFVGLAEPVATVKFLGAASALPDDSDYIGFYRVNAGDLQFVVRNDNAAGTAVEYNVDVQAAADITNAGYVKLGFRVSGGQVTEVYIDGAKVVNASDTGTKIAVTTTSLPIEPLCRTVSVGRGETANNATVECLVDSIECYVAE